MIEPKREDFYEITLHHVVASSLIIYGYLLNVSDAVMIVFWMIAVTDVFVMGGKMSVNVKNGIMKYVFIAGVLLLWPFV